MIVTQKMEKPVDEENVKLCFRRMADPSSLLFQDRSTNHEITEVALTGEDL
jgi:hypothetical protein